MQANSFRRFPSLTKTALSLLVTSCGFAVGCGDSNSGPAPELREGQTDFSSAPPGGGGGQRENAAGDDDDSAAGDSGDSPKSPTAGGESGGPKRDVEETDLYRLDGDRLYYLNAYRGLMVFDVSNVDQPRLLGRSAIYGQPVQMIVRDGVASVVVADWYGVGDDGAPFHGSIVRGIDATDPAHMKVVGEAKLGGWVKDTRVVGDVLYAVTEKYSWDTGWYGYAEGDRAAVSSGASVSVASVNLAGGRVAAIDNYDVPGYGGVFHVTAESILLASDVTAGGDANNYGTPTGETELRYLDIRDPGGKIAQRGTARVGGSVQSWGADQGRWNLDFADGKMAHAVARTNAYGGRDGTSSITLSTVDFTNPDAPVVAGQLEVASPGWDAAARFDGTRLYLTPTTWGCGFGGASGSLSTPLDVYDFADPARPVKLGSTAIEGQIDLMIPNGDRLFALGHHYSCDGDYASPIALAYFDVSDPAQPKAIGSAEFGRGWAWTPASGTFKAFTKDDARGLVVLPFSGWDDDTYTYNNGLQLIEFTPASIAPSGTASTKGWVERGIFVKDRLVSLSDQSLSVVDYSNRASPRVAADLTLARNVVNVRPVGANVVEVSSDFWGNDVDHSELRVLPAAEAEDNVSGAALSTLPIDGTNPTVFHHGELTYVVSSVRSEAPCPAGRPGESPRGGVGAKAQACYSWRQEVQVVDVAGGGAVARGKVALPELGGGYYGGYWGWYGCGMNDWYYGADVVQVGGDKLAFRRWQPRYDEAGEYVDALQSLYVVDLANPDAPTLASTVITEERDGWWGNLRAVGDQLYASHYEWQRRPDGRGNDPGVVRYFVDRIDLSDPTNPYVSQKINVPGMLVGGSADDPSTIYTIDYHWDGERVHNDLAILKVSGDRAVLQGALAVPGNTGNVFVRGSTAYFSAMTYADNHSSMALYQVDLSDPRRPVVLPSEKTQGWGWLLSVEGDRAFVTSGWGGQGIDVFKLEAGKAPAFDQFVRARGWWPSSLARSEGGNGDTAFLASGYWGTQAISLAPAAP